MRGSLTGSMHCCAVSAFQGLQHASMILNGLAPTWRRPPRDREYAAKPRLEHVVYFSQHLVSGGHNDGLMNGAIELNIRPPFIAVEMLDHPIMHVSDFP